LTREAFAAGPLPVSISPTRIEFAANRGDRLTGTVEFWNGTDSWLPVHIEPEDIRQGDEQGHVVRDAEDPANSLKAWVKSAIPDVTVAPKTKIPLDFTMDVPTNADPGSHWGGLAVVTTPIESGGGAAIQVRIGTILLVNVYGEAREKLTLESFIVPRFLETPPVTLVARFRNEGTVHEKPEGTMEIRDVFDRIVATSTLPERNVLPRTVRRIAAEAGSGFWIGRYTALLRTTYGTGNEVLLARATFWVVPWRKYGLPFVIFLGGFVFVIVKRRQFAEASYVLATGKDRSPGPSRRAPAEERSHEGDTAPEAQGRKARKLDL